MGWARKVLGQYNQPLHIDKLTTLIQELSGLTVRKATLVSNLSRYVKAGDTFTREGEGIYGLIQFRQPGVQRVG